MFWSVQYKFCDAKFRIHCRYSSRKELIVIDDVTFTFPPFSSLLLLSETSHRFGGPWTSLVFYLLLMFSTPWKTSVKI